MNDQIPVKDAAELLSLVEELTEYHFKQNRLVTIEATREQIPMEPLPGDKGPRLRKGSLTITIRAEVP